MTEKNWLFYSENCSDSKYLISIMDSETLLQYFFKVCVDDSPKLREQISITPTIMVKNIPYCGGEAFKWVATIKQWKINLQLKSASQKQQQYMNTISTNLSEKNNILEFSKNEMGDGVDLFAYLHSESAMPRGYVDYDNIGKENIFTPPLENGSYKISEKGKLDKKQHIEKYKQLKSDREDQSMQLKNMTDSFKKQYKN